MLDGLHDGAIFHGLVVEDRSWLARRTGLPLERNTFPSVVNQDEVCEYFTGVGGGSILIGWKSGRGLDVPVHRESLDQSG